MTETVEQAVDRYRAFQRVQYSLQSGPDDDPWLERVEELMDEIWWSFSSVRCRLMEESFRGH